MDEPSSDNARRKLEFDKLKLEFDILDQSRSAEADKLALEIHEMKNAPRRATIAALSTILLGIAGILISLAGFVLNRTIDNSAEKQRTFDNYIGLSKQFAQTGAQKIAAIVGEIAFGSGPMGLEVSGDDWTVNKDLPDFTAADWWDVDGIDDDVKAMLERAYPKKIEEPLTHLKTEDKMKHCVSGETIRPAGTARNR